MFKSYVSQSDDIDSLDAIEEIIDDLVEQLGTLEPQAGLLYSGIDFEHQLILDRILQQWPELKLIGGTTDGEFSSASGFLEDSLVLTLLCSDNIEFSVGVGHGLNKDISKACEQAVKSAKTSLGKVPELCITIPGSLTANGDDIIDSLKQALGEKFPIFGGLSADQWKFIKPYQFYNNQVLEDSVPVLLFSGPLHYSSGVEVGWTAIGDPVKITKSIGSTVFEIDNMTTQEFYQQKLGSSNATPGEVPLAILDENGEHSYLRASIMNFNDDQSLNFIANVPEGASVQICRSERELMLQGCRDSVNTAIKNYPQGNQPDVILCFSCAGRHKHLGTRSKEEAEIVQEHFKDSEVSFSGFYTYGEIGKVSSNNTTNFHNQTFITLLMGEAK